MSVKRCKLKNMVYKPCPECGKHIQSSQKVGAKCVFACSYYCATGDVVKFFIIAINESNEVAYGELQRHTNVTAN